MWVSWASRIFASQSKMGGERTNKCLKSSGPKKMWRLGEKKKIKQVSQQIKLVFSRRSPLHCLSVFRPWRILTVHLQVIMNVSLSLTIYNTLKLRSRFDKHSVRDSKRKQSTNHHYSKCTSCLSLIGSVLQTLFSNVTLYTVYYNLVGSREPTKAEESE